MHEIDQISQYRWLDCSNASSSNIIPAFGAVRVVDTSTDGILQVDQPNADSQDVLINGPVPIAPGGTGVCTWNHPVFALYESGDGSPALDEAWGAGNGTYKLRKGKTGFLGDGPSSLSATRSYFRRSFGGGGASHACRLSGGGAFISGGGTTQTLTWSTEDKDTDNYHDNSTNPTRITIPSGLDGDYMIAFATLLSSSGTFTIGQAPRAEIQKNGGAITTIGGVPILSGTTSKYAMNGCIEVALAATNYLEVVIINADTNGVSTSSSWFSVRKVDKAG